MTITIPLPYDFVVVISGLVLLIFVYSLLQRTVVALWRRIFGRGQGQRRRRRRGSRISGWSDGSSGEGSEGGDG